MTTLSIIIPAYNETNRIIPTLSEITKYTKQSPNIIDVIVVDDGSSDNTQEVVKEFATKFEFIHLHSLEKNKGKGFAVKTGILMSTGKIVAFMDADGSTPISEIDKVIAPILSGATDIAIGSRYIGDSEILVKQPLYRTIWSRLANSTVQKFILSDIKDPHCGFKAFKSEVAKEVFSKVNIKEWSFDLEALAIAQQLNYLIEEVAVQWKDDKDSKVKKRHLFKEVYNAFKIHKTLKGLH